METDEEEEKRFDCHEQRESPTKWGRWWEKGRKSSSDWCIRSWVTEGEQGGWIDCCYSNQSSSEKRIEGRKGATERSFHQERAFPLISWNSKRKQEGKKGSFSREWRMNISRNPRAEGFWGFPGRKSQSPRYLWRKTTRKLRRFRPNSSPLRRDAPELWLCEDWSARKGKARRDMKLAVEQGGKIGIACWQISPHLHSSPVLSLRFDLRLLFLRWSFQLESKKS